MSDASVGNRFATRLPGFIRRDPAVVIAFACIILLLLVGSLYSRNFLSPEYLLQQLKVASFLGVIATGMMLVILLGQIDLSVPWVVTAGAMMACAVASFGPVGVALSVPFGVALRRRPRTAERRRRRLPAHPLDDHHARHQCRRAGADGGLFGRLLAARLRLAADALPGDRLHDPRRPERRRRLGDHRRRSPCSC